MDDLGTLTEHDRRTAVRFVRHYPHAIDVAWEAISTPAGLSHWFPASVAVDLRVGGTITFTNDEFAPDCQGTVLECDPPTRLWFTWGANELHFELAAEGESACRFTLTDVLAARGDAARNGAGWSVCLGELDKHVAGAVAIGPHSDTAQPWQPYFDAYVAAGFPADTAHP